MFSTAKVKKAKFHFNFLANNVPSKCAELGPQGRSQMSAANVAARQKVQLFISFGVSIFDCFRKPAVQKSVT